MPALIGTDGETMVNVTAYGESGRARYQITRMDDHGGARHITLAAGQIIALAAILADLIERRAIVE